MATKIIEQLVAETVAQGIYPVAYALSIHTVEILKAGKYPEYVIESDGSGIDYITISGYKLMILPIPSRIISSQYILGNESIASQSKKRLYATSKEEKIKFLTDEIKKLEERSISEVVITTKDGESVTMDLSFTEQLRDFQDAFNASQELT